ncbi:hypothetical protein CCP4SC76_2820001 [Gammaproteobacteria bacterium]
MAFTSGNDINIVQSSDTATMGAGAGNDTYILSPFTLTGTEKITISDGQGTNSIQLVSGLKIKSSSVTSDALKLVLDNGSEITVLGASTFTFEPGGNATAGIDKTDVSFANFAKDTLGVTVPAAGAAAVTGGAVTVGSTTGATYTLTNGTANSAEGTGLEFTLTATTAPAADTTFLLSVQGDTLGGNATAATASGTGVDFSTLPTSVTMKAGETTAKFTITPATDSTAETLEGYKVSVLSGATTVASATASITDVTADTTPPVIATGQTISYGDNVTASTTLGTVAATDASGVASFAIASGDSNHYFQIDSNGNISLTAAGAAAGVTSHTAGNTFTLGITATDKAATPNTSTAVSVGLTVTDKTSPTLSSTNPVVISGTSLSMNFSESLANSGANLPVAGDFSVIAGGSTVMTINSVAVSGSTVTLTLASAPSGTVTVAYTPNSTASKVLMDAAGNAVAAISSTTAVTDVTAPTLSSSTPADGATSVAVGDNIVLNMSETVKAGTGNIVVTNANDATDIRTIAVGDATQVTISGSQVTINPTADLKTGGHYVVTMVSGVLKDIAGLSFAGISGTNLDFYTTGASAGGQTFTLTTATDSIPGLTGSKGTTDNSGDDSIIGDFVSSTVNASDQINGGTGTNTFKVYGSATVANFTKMPVSVTNVQTLDIVTGADSSPLNFSGYTKATSGIASIVVEDVSAMGGNATWDRITTTTGQSLSLGTGPTGAVLAGANLNWAAPNTDTTLNLTLTGFQGGLGVTPLAFGITSGAAATALNITSTGATNKIGAFTTPSTVMSHVIAGDTAFTYAPVAANVAALNSIAANSDTGGVNANLVASLTKSAFTFTGGSGNDSVTFIDNEFGTLTAGSQLDGGAGTTDKIGISDTSLSAAEASKVNATTGFEVLGLNAAITLAANQLTSIKSFSLDTNAAQTVSNMATGSTLSVTATHPAAASIGGNVGVSDVTISVGVPTSTGFTVGGVAGGSSLTVAQTTVALSSNGTGTGLANSIASLANADNSTYTITGSNNLNIQAMAATTTGSSVNAGGFNGMLYVNGTGKADVLTGGTAADKLDGGAGGDTLTGNAGADQFIYSALSNSLAGTGYDIISGFTAGTDKIALQTAVGTLSQGGTFTAVGTGALGTDIGTALTAGGLTIAANNAAIVTVTGTGAGTYLVINDGTAGFSATTDAVIMLSGLSGTMSVADFTVGTGNTITATGAGGMDVSYTTNAISTNQLFTTKFADTITATGATTATISGGDGADTITLPAAGAADTVILNGSSAITLGQNPGGADTIANFVSAEDSLQLGSTWLNGFSAANAEAVSDLDSNSLAAAVDGSFAVISDANVSQADVVNAFTAAFTSAMSTVVFAYDGTNTNIYYVNNNLDGTGSNTVASTEVVLIGTLSAINGTGFDGAGVETI